MIHLETPPTTSPSPSASSPLRDLGPIRLFVASDAPDDDAVLNPKHVGSFAQVMLKIARIPVVTTKTHPNTPKLQISIRSIKASDLYSIYLTVELLDRVWLARTTGNEDALDASTWRKFNGFMSNADELRSNLRENLGKLLASFMNEYVAANANNGHQRIQT